MKTIALRVLAAIALLTLAACVSNPPVVEERVIYQDRTRVIEVPDSYLAPTAPPAPVRGSCSLSPVDWKACATERAAQIVTLYTALGQSNADKVNARKFIKDQKAIIQKAESKP